MRETELNISCDRKMVLSKKYIILYEQKRRYGTLKCWITFVFYSLSGKFCRKASEILSFRLILKRSDKNRRIIVAEILYQFNGLVT